MPPVVNDTTRDIQGMDGLVKLSKQNGRGKKHGYEVKRG